MSSKRLFLYPMKPHEQLEAKNPYLFNLAKCLKNHFTIVNYGRPQNKSFTDIARYFWRADVFYFNWIENTGSTISYAFLKLFITAAKALGKKVVWTHHNIHPHNDDGYVGKKIIRLFARSSNHVVSHTKLSKKLLGLSNSDSRLLYHFHPFFSKPELFCEAQAKVYDILIWGNMRRSKGIDSFMRYLLDNNLLDKYSIKIIGKFESEGYFKDFMSLYKGKKISIENRYADNSELIMLHRQAKFVFFPYTGSSVLNSGALITSIPYGACIIGPSNGVFTEIGDAGFIKLYKDFDDVASYVDSYSEADIPDPHRVSKLCEENTWDAFASFIYDKLTKSEE
jgi:beta-1,4-mannosyltransferase